MSSNEILDLLKLLLVLPRVAFWPAVAWGLDTLRGLGGVAAGLLALVLLAAPAGLAQRLQLRLNETLDRRPETRIGPWAWLKLEIWHSVLALPLWPFRLLVAVGRGLARRKKVVAETAGIPAAVEPPLLVASLGPGFLLAGLATVAVYGLSRAADPFLRAQLGLSRGLPAWQYLFLGRRPELAWYLPVGRYPFLAGLLALLVWVLIWTLLGAVLRTLLGRHLGRNLAADREREDVLPLWRRWCGAPTLAAPGRSYLEWAAWPVLAASPLLIWAWFSLGGDPYRVGSSEFAVASLLWTSWALHLVLRGRDRIPVAVEEPEAAPETRANGWPEVLAHLLAERTERVAAPPEPWEERTAEPLPLSEVDPRMSGVLSPLVAELLPAPRKLTLLQRSVLTKLALKGFVHVEPPVALEHLTLAEHASDVLQDRSGQRVRHQIVLAPEGQGKTTLALLAAANHALVHTRSTLVVVRSEEGAAALAERFHRAIEPSPLRWNVRVRHPGADLMNDLSQGILPDVVVCSLRDLVLTVLDQAETFAPVLRNIGLIVVDDVESFIGPVEVHAQLAFRRLALRLGGLKEEGAPQFLVLGCDGMEEMGKWARSLCGIDAVVRSFSRSAQEARERETAELAAEGIALRSETRDEILPLHHLYRLRDFRSGDGDRLGTEGLVAACERLAVPWHYRLCGDGRRDLGRGPLLLREEPSHHVEAPEEACVVVLEGTWSEVQREWRRLVRAGARFSRFRGPGGEAIRHAGEPAETIAFVSLVDPDVEMAFTHFDAGFTLAPALGSLPRPVLRPPGGTAVEPHLSVDLVQHWTEVEDLLRVFGGATAPTLTRLAREGLLLCEPRTDVDDRANEYVEKVYVRTLARAVRLSRDGEGLLPPKVGQVEVASQNLVTVRDRTTLTELDVVDESSAHFVYYPGRIFKDARGTFVVVGRQGGGASGDVLVEPLLSNEISSPRRRYRVRPLAGGEEVSEPRRVLLGRCSFHLGLEPVEVRVEHRATWRLGPVHCEIRQRTLLDPETRTRLLDLPLATVALALIPDPEEPRLTLGGARLLAAALRALLPVLYRGAGESLQVALREDGSLYLFDTEHGGNGTARALYRDGVELPLRLARLMIERVLSPERLRALFDEWDEEEDAGEEPRQNLLAWLESRLQPEGGPEGWYGPGQPQSGTEPREGDLFDLGRCWYSQEGAVFDLVWAKHRWRLPGRGEAMLDIGFDRGTATEARAPARVFPVELPEPREVWFLAEGETEPRKSAIPSPETLRPRHLQAVAAIQQSATALAPLAGLLRDRSGTAEPLALARFLGHFVRAIPPARSEGTGSPVDTLLRRAGDERARCLLLGALLRSCGIETGLLVPAEGTGARVAAALTESLDAAGSPAFWAELPEGRRYVPLSVSTGQVETVRPASLETWSFLPFPDLNPGEPEP
ncbi:MAG TPA: DEAD/DEAH box helicase [Thermoanaerobaculia bacterium]|nr:DEAD/DEAH box helicase [Thermoanaerobaculia bacterium]